MTATARLPFDPILLDICAVARLLSCSPRHVARMADTGQLPPPIKLGRVIGWRREVIAIVSRPGHNDVMAHVVLRPEAGKQLDGLPPRIKDRMYKLLARLESWPSVSGAKPLRGNLAGRFRMRTGDYRLQFRVEGQTVTVERIGHRDGFYGG